MNVVHMRILLRDIIEKTTQKLSRSKVESCKKENIQHYERQ